MSSTKKSSFFRKDASEREVKSDVAVSARPMRKPKADWVKSDEPKTAPKSAPKSAPKTERKSAPKTERAKDGAKGARGEKDRPKTAVRERAKGTWKEKERSSMPPKSTTDKPATKTRGKKDVVGVLSQTSVRLNRFIAQSGVCSRREADELIASGAVTINDVVTTELGTKVDPSVDIVKYDGKRLSGEKLVYIIMNKPKGYVTSLDDPHNEDTVIGLLKGQVRERVYPVGRLDKNTTGVLLLTNDGELTSRLTHPSYERSKIYHIFLDKPCSEEDLEKIASGIELEDGEIHADEVSYVEGNRKEVGIEIHSGRNRIVRRIFEHLGYRVIKLDRVFFAGLTKMGLRRGFWRYLSPKEIMTLKNDN